MGMNFKDEFGWKWRKYEKKRCSTNDPFLARGDHNYGSRNVGVVNNAVD